MKLAAGAALAAVVGEDELAADYIVPSVFNREIVTSGAAAVSAAAKAAGIARKL